MQALKSCYTLSHHYICIENAGEGEGVDTKGNSDPPAKSQPALEQTGDRQTQQQPIPTLIFGFGCDTHSPPKPEPRAGPVKGDSCYKLARSFSAILLVTACTQNAIWGCAHGERAIHTLIPKQRWDERPSSSQLTNLIWYLLLYLLHREICQGEPRGSLLCINPLGT